MAKEETNLSSFLKQSYMQAEKKKWKRSRTDTRSRRKELLLPTVNYLKSFFLKKLKGQPFNIVLYAPRTQSAEEIVLLYDR